jgi:hypothetical protein
MVDSKVQDIYDDFRMIRKMKASFPTKHRMLWELLSMSGENKDFWQVVGITELAFNKIVQNDVDDAKKSIKDNRIQRAHIKKRIETSRVMLEDPIKKKDAWWKFYLDSDKCVLATASENLRKEPELKKYDVPQDLFKCSGFGYIVSKDEINFLKKLKEDRGNG